MLELNLVCIIMILKKKPKTTGFYDTAEFTKVSIIDC